MASTSAVLLLFFAGLFTVITGDDCKSYYTSDNVYKPWSYCSLLGQHCCGTCNNRYCCFTTYSRLSDHEQDVCNIVNETNNFVIGSVIVVVVILFVLFITCCCCPCCCMYSMCRKPRPVVGTQVTAITNTSVIQQQPAVQAIQYQPVPTQLGYAPPMQVAPYQGQPYAPGPPPSYHVATGPGYPAYDGGQVMYPTQPPAQPGPVYTAPETSNQPPYNPAYMQPPNTSY